MKYTYKCEPCNREYSEIREVTDPQFFTDCTCGNKFELIKEEEQE